MTLYRALLLRVGKPLLMSVFANSRHCKASLQFQAKFIHTSSNGRCPLYQKADSTKPKLRHKLKPIMLPVKGVLPCGERVIVDRGREEEVDTLLQYFRDAASGIQGYGPEEFEDSDYEKNILKITKAHVLTFKAESSHKLQAVLVINLNYFSRMHNMCDVSLVVVPSARQKGLGHFASMFATDFAWSQGYDGIISDVLETNHKMMDILSWVGVRRVGYLGASFRRPDRSHEFIGSYLYFFDFILTDVSYFHANFTKDGLYQPKPRYELSKGSNI